MHGPIADRGRGQHSGALKAEATYPGGGPRRVVLQDVPWQATCRVCRASVLVGQLGPVLMPSTMASICAHPLGGKLAMMRMAVLAR